MKKISLCTVCMNRHYHLSQTLPVNLAENSDDPNVEFLVLDYNSRDNMEDWVKENLQGYIASGKLKYYKTYEPEFFDMAHSKNLILKLAEGDIIGTIDADNFAGPGYAQWVGECFSTYGHRTITTTLRQDSIPYRDQGGKMCFSREMFYSVNGFDEALIGYGMDDVDLVNRMENSGGRRVFIDEERFLRFIGHTDMERLINYRYPNYLDRIYHLDHQQDLDHQRLLYLFKDNTFSEMNYSFNESLRTNPVITFGGWTMDSEQGRRDGCYERKNGELYLHFNNGAVAVVCAESGSGTEKELTNLLAPALPEWRELKREEDIFSIAALAYCECQNRLKYIENGSNAHPINASGWGRGTVFCNFDRERPIFVN